MLAMSRDPPCAAGLTLATRFDHSVHGFSVIAAIDARQQPRTFQKQEACKSPMLTPTLSGTVLA
jgi:hypothetical protein